MGKYKYLIKNIGLLTISNFATKLLSFFLVPLYTSVLTTEQYGTYDLFNTTIQLLIPLLTINIQEAVLRFLMDNNADTNKIWSIGCRYSLISCGIVFVFDVANRYLGIFTSLQQYWLEFFLLYSITTFSGLIVYYSRGIGKIADLSVAGVLSSAITIFCNILFLLVFKMELHGYFSAMILGQSVQCAFLVYKTRVWKNTKLFKNDFQLRENMISYSKPMVANSISWWVNNASDRYVVTWLRGIGTNGIYSVSYKIPSIMVVLQGIFSQAWTLSATKEFDKDDKDSFFINIYNTYNFILVFICSFLIFMDKPLAKLLFAKEFYSAWKYAPFLMISTIFSGLAAFLGGVLSALKKSSLFAKSSVITAFVNTILNIILVIFIGPIGAAISTAFAYLLMWIIRLQLVKQCINLKVNLIRDSLAYLILNIQAVLLLVTLKNNVFCWYQIIFILVILLLYIREGKAIVSRALKRFCNR